MSTSTEAGGHTPGPWDVTPSPGGYRRKPCFVVRSTVTPGRTRIARVDDERDANHIASVPSLLAELAALKASNAALVEALKNALPFVRMRANRNEGGVLDREQDLATVTEHEIRALLASVQA